MLRGTIKHTCSHHYHHMIKYMRPPLCETLQMKPKTFTSPGHTGVYTHRQQRRTRCNVEGHTEAFKVQTNMRTLTTHIFATECTGPDQHTHYLQLSFLISGIIVAPTWPYILALPSKSLHPGKCISPSPYYYQTSSAAA